jgi:hypothetical protein
MNTTTTKIAGEAMTDEQIDAIWDQTLTKCDGHISHRAFARALLASKAAVPEGWKPMATAPRDGSNILIRFGRDGVSQAKYVAGTPHPWKFIDTNDGITWLINHAVDTEYGPTHWMPMPDATAPAQSCGEAEQADEAVTERHMRFLGLLQIGGCTCLTKTPELQYHAEDCKYRLAAEIHQALRPRAKDSK